VVAHSRLVTLPLLALDEVPHEIRMLGLSAAGTSPSGVARIRFGTSPSLSDAAWQPFTTTVQLPDSKLTGLWVQVQDRAGNNSQATLVPIHHVPGSRLDQAIALEETAQDQSAALQWTQARYSIKSSIPRLVEIVEEVLEQHPSKADTKHVIDAVGTILDHKAHALLWMNAKQHAKADAELLHALTLERDLAAWGDAHHLSFAEQEP
jgi:hypothetical protein